VDGNREGEGDKEVGCLGKPSGYDALAQGETACRSFLGFHGQSLFYGLAIGQLDFFLLAGVINEATYEVKKIDNDYFLEG
jgi:restriction endonuclease Mrr